MMATNLKLATPDPPPRSPERAALADVIERRNALAREIENANSALRKAHEHRMDAQARLEKNQEDSEAAVNIDEFISAVQSGSDIDHQLRAAGHVREDIEQLTRDFDMWQRTEEACRQRVTELERDAKYILSDSQVDAVIKTEANVDELLDGLEPMWIEVNRRLSILRWLHGNRRIKDDDVKKVFSAIKYNLIDDSEAVDEWRQVIKNLMQNADAELPK